MKMRFSTISLLSLFLCTQAFTYDATLAFLLSLEGLNVLRDFVTERSLRHPLKRYNQKESEMKSEIMVVAEEAGIDASNIEARIELGGEPCLAEAFSNPYYNGKKYIIFSAYGSSPLDLYWPKASTKSKKHTMRAVIRHELSHIENKDAMGRAAFHWLSIIPAYLGSSLVKSLLDKTDPDKTDPWCSTFNSAASLVTAIGIQLVLRNTVLPIYDQYCEKRADLSIKNTDDLQAFIGLLKHTKNITVESDRTHPLTQDRINYLEKHLDQLISAKQEESETRVA